MLTATEQQVKMAAQLYEMRDKGQRNALAQGPGGFLPGPAGATG